MLERTIKVNGMSCGHCKAKVEGALSGLSGVNSAEVDLDQGTVRVLYDDQSLAESVLHEAISDAGYEVAV